MLQELGEVFAIDINGRCVAVCGLLLPTGAQAKEEDVVLLAAACTLAQVKP